MMEREFSDLVSKKGKLPLVFIDKGVKINQKYYIEEVLEKNLLPNANILYGDDCYCFQQDSTPAHTGNQSQRWCEENLPDFIPKTERPPSSPDSNPLDFIIYMELYDPESQGRSDRAFIAQSKVEEIRFVLRYHSIKSVF